MTLLPSDTPPRRCAIPLLVELCAGTAALSLRLERAKARPPVSRMGAKTGYADIILALAGLKPGDKAEHYLWCEPDDGVRLLLHAYRDADLAREAAAIIRSWADEDPRALWERLRAEGPAVCPPVEAKTIARWSFVQTNKAPHADCWKTVPRAAVACGVEANLSAEGLASRFAGGLPATIHDDARTLLPREVARWLNSEAWTNGGRYMGPDRPSSCHPPGWVASITSAGLASRADNLGGLPATIHDDARTLAPPVPLPEGTLVYIDPPYLNTTGYADAFPREEWLPVLRRWADAGARCMVSEAEPIPDLVADGWHAVEITAMRVGQKRTFSKQQAEWVTMNFEPDARAARTCERALDRARRREQVTQAEQRTLFDP